MADGGSHTLSEGQRASLKKTVTARDVELYAEATGDCNPIHMDEGYAATTVFGRRIAHGMLSAGLISNVLANMLPGPGTVYLSQSLSFKAPVFLEDEIDTTVEVLSVREDKPIATLKTECVKADGTLVVTGEAVVLWQR